MRQLFRKKAKERSKKEEVIPVVELLPDTPSLLYSFAFLRESCLKYCAALDNLNSAKHKEVNQDQVQRFKGFQPAAKTVFCCFLFCLPVRRFAVGREFFRNPLGTVRNCNSLSA